MTNVVALRDTIRNTSQGIGIDDFTVAGLGDPSLHKAVFCFGNQSGQGEDGQPVDMALHGFGCAVSPTGRLSHANRVNHNDSTDADGHMTFSDRIYARMSPTQNAVNVSLDFDSWITDGFRAYVSDTVSKSLYLNGLIFSGQNVQADIKKVTVASTVDGYTDTPISFEPNFGIAFTDGDQYNGVTGHVGFATQSICFYRNDKAGVVHHAGLSISHVGDADYSPVGCYGYVSDQYLPLCDPRRNYLDVDWLFEISFPDSTTMRITTRKVGGDPQPPEVGVLLLDLDVDVSVGVMDVPNATGATEISGVNFANPFSFEPQAIVWLVSQMSSVNIYHQENDEAGTVGIAIADSMRNFCATTSVRNGVSVSDSQSLSDTKLNVPLHNGTDGVKADFVGFLQGGVSVNVVNSVPSVLKWPYVAIDKASNPQPNCCDVLQSRIDDLESRFNQLVVNLGSVVDGV